MKNNAGLAGERDMYDLYKPFRNLMARTSTVDALVNIWVYSAHLAYNIRVPSEYLPAQPTRWAPGIAKLLHPWDLDILCREIVLNGNPVGDLHLADWTEMARVINSLRELENSLSRRFSSPDVVLRDLHRIVQQQFPWQRPPTMTSLHRYYQVFQQGEVSKYVSECLGMSVTAFFRLGVALSGHFSKSPMYVAESEAYTAINISDGEFRTFLDTVAITLEELKDRTQAVQRYDASWPYTYNPLRATPLVRVDPQRPERIICPIPEFLFRRVSEGLYFDCVKHPKFGNAYGAAFENYVGMVLHQIYGGSEVTVERESEYHVAAGRKHGVDWIVSDKSANIFIECKTRRLNQDAKADAAGALDEAIKGMAGYVVQNYKNILDIERGITKWKDNGLPSYSLLLTLENWHLFSPALFEVLENAIFEQLDASGIDRTILDRIPYTITSVEDFEVAGQVMGRTGIHPFMQEKTDAEHKQWALSGFLPSKYREEMKHVRRKLFDFDFGELLGMPNTPGLR